MAKDYCKYHPLTTAKWRCPQCCILFCDDCAPAGNDMESAPPCILCTHALESVSQRAQATPFWQRFTEFLQLPFTWTGGALLALCALVPLLLPGSVAAFSGMAGYIISGLAGWAVLLRAATGQLSLPAAQDFPRSAGLAAIQVAVLISVVIFGLTVLDAHTTVFAFLLMMGLSIAGPLLLVAAANEKGLAGLANTEAVRRVLSAMGLMVIPAAGFTLLLMLALQAVTGLMSDVASPAVLQCLRNGFYGYGILVVSALSGYCQYQYRPAFEEHYEGLKQRTKRAAVRRLDANTSRLEVFLKEGMFDKAVALMKGWAEKNKNNSDIQERYFQLLVFLKDKDGVAWQGENYIASLMAGKQSQDALRVLTKIQMVMPEFRPEEPAVTFDLAKACVECREFKRAADLLDGLHQTAPHFPELPEAYMLRAKLLHEKLEQPAQALEVMDFLVARSQRHPRYEVMKAYWTQLGGRPAAEPGFDQ